MRTCDIGSNRPLRSTGTSRRRSALASLAVVALASLGACGIDDDLLPPTVGDVAGRYVATRAIVMARDLSEGTAVWDVIALGGSIHVDLRADGTMTGRVFVPGVGFGGTDVDRPLDGTWMLHQGAVLMRPESGTFMSSIAFLVRGHRLDGSYVRRTSPTSDQRYQILLERR